MVTYPFPIRAGVLAELRLPVDLSGGAADRVGTFVKAIAITNPATHSGVDGADANR